MAEPQRTRPGKRGRSDAVRALAASQAGVVTRAQLREPGMSTSAIDRALRSQRLHRLHRGVYAAVPPELLNEDGVLLAALAVAGHGAMLAGGTAAWRWGLIAAPPTFVQLCAPGPRRAPEGIVLFQAARLRAGDIARNGRFPTTGVARTLLDLAARYEKPPLLRALAEAEFRHDLRPADVVATLRRGHPGSARLRAALDAHVPGRGVTKSGLERRFRRLLIAHGIPLPERNVRVGRWEVDCLWRDRRVAVELDGRQHERPHQAGVDDARDLWLRRHGHVVRRYGTAQLRDHPHQVVADLREALALPH